MGGKAALLLVLSFSVLFLVFAGRFNWMTTDSVDNLVDYYTETKAQNLAVSGANMAANEIFFNGNWDVGFANLSMDGGKINVGVKAIGTERLVIANGEYGGVTKEVRIRYKPSSFAKFAYYMNLFGGNDIFKTGDTLWGPVRARRPACLLPASLHHLTANRHSQSRRSR